MYRPGATQPHGPVYRHNGVIGLFFCLFVVRAIGLLQGCEILRRRTTRGAGPAPASRRFLILINMVVIGNYIFIARNYKVLPSRRFLEAAAPAPMEIPVPHKDKSHVEKVEPDQGASFPQHQLPIA